jgi:hypothetical protein
MAYAAVVLPIYAELYIDPEDGDEEGDGDGESLTPTPPEVIGWGESMRGFLRSIERRVVLCERDNCERDYLERQQWEALLN